MTRNKKTKQQRLRNTPFVTDYNLTIGKTCTKGSHKKHGIWLEAKPLQQLQRWVLPFGYSHRLEFLKRKPRRFTGTVFYLPYPEYKLLMFRYLCNH